SAAYFRFGRLSSTSSSCASRDLCCGLSASHLRALFTRASICARGRPSTPVSSEASSASWLERALSRISAIFASAARRSRFVTSFRVFSYAMARPPGGAMLASRGGFYQRVARAIGPHRAVGDQLVEVRRERTRRHAVDARRHVVVSQWQQLFDGSLAELLQGGQNLAFARHAVRDQAPDLALRLADQVAVPRSEDGEILGEQHLERVEVGAHVAIGRVDHHGR